MFKTRQLPDDPPFISSIRQVISKHNARPGLPVASGSALVTVANEQGLNEF